MSLHKDQELKVLKYLSEKLSYGKEVTEIDQESLINIIENFKDFEKNQIYQYFENKLSQQECDVFYNFFKNIKDISGILSSLQNKEKVSDDDIRNFFFNGKYIAKSLFSDTYRDILDYVQRDLNVKCKAEILSDLKIYFETGCFDEDLSKDRFFNSAINSQYSSKKRIYDYIMLKSQARNIPVKAIEDQKTGNKTIEIVEQLKNKVGVASSGLIDCVKRTPLGIVVSMSTSDGKITRIQERKQLAKHLSCLEFGILKGDFKYTEFSQEKRVESIDEIYQVKFNLLTEFSAKVKYNLQDKLRSIGVDNERMTFLTSCMSRVLISAEISDDLKDKIVLEGFACKGISIDESKNISGLIINEIDKLIINEKEIINLRNFGAFAQIDEYFENLIAFLKNDIPNIRVQNYEKLCDVVNNFITIFSNNEIIPKYTAINLSRIFNPEQLKNDYQIFSIDFKEHQKNTYKKQMRFIEKKIEKTKEINDLLIEKFSVSERSIEQVMEFNAKLTRRKHIIETRQKTALKKELIDLDKEIQILNQKKGRNSSKINNYMNISFAEKLYIENNPDFAEKLIRKYNFKNDDFDVASYKYKENTVYSGIILEIKKGQNNRKINPLK